MNNFERDLLAWVEGRLDAILSRPASFGDREAVEFQVLLLLEVRSFLVDPLLLVKKSRRVVDEYHLFLTEGRLDAPPQYLASIAGLSDVEFVRRLGEFCSHVRASLAVVPVPHRPEVGEIGRPSGAVTMALTFVESLDVSLGDLSGYWSRWQRAIVAVAMEMSLTPVQRERERLRQLLFAGSSYSIREFRFPRRLGDPFVLAFARPEGMGEPAISPKVYDAFQYLIALLRWASHPQSDLGLHAGALWPSGIGRVVGAIQAMRLATSPGVASITVGGDEVGRPIVLRPNASAVLFRLLLETCRPSEFEQEMQVHSVDFASGRIELESDEGDRVGCYVPSGDFPITRVGVLVRAAGTLFEPDGMEPFVILARLEMTATR